ncbi:DUF4360 domain-containing protein [Micromonospora sp. WMMD1102]|uniref:DUF4360 domain-containing protein n=1 Tax=Micromonospora sp. WMMD1102 TaxID=3016105 RepID=UPI002414F54C|nr:DUF4360 domain-containing protein [Micromonospora sp. WMMD1102]MDG4790782.1 DUF4360 domain-containing protein [Micromonospora sp. WMMD1102]
MLNTLVIGGLAASLLGLPVLGDPVPTTNPPAERITMEVVTVNGSGCRPGTAAVATAPDNTAFTVTYSDYLAQAGAGTAPTDFRKNCQLVLKVNVPGGFTYAIRQADYRGFAHLEKGASGMQRASYYIQGTSPTAVESHTIPGPMSDSWQTTDVTDMAELVYAPCGEVRLLNINTELRVNRGTSNPATTSFLMMDSTDSSVSTTYHFNWMRCE